VFRCANVVRRTFDGDETIGGDGQTRVTSVAAAFCSRLDNMESTKIYFDIRLTKLQTQISKESYHVDSCFSYG
jgi:hypothetical protein